MYSRLEVEVETNRTHSRSSSKGASKEARERRRYILIASYIRHFPLSRERNRLLAKRTRTRNKQLIEDLKAEITALKDENQVLGKRLREAEEQLSLKSPTLNYDLYV